MVGRSHGCRETFFSDSSLTGDQSEEGRSRKTVTGRSTTHRDEGQERTSGPRGPSGVVKGRVYLDARGDGAEGLGPDGGDILCTVYYRRCVLATLSPLSTRKSLSKLFTNGRGNHGPRQDL